MAAKIGQTSGSYEKSVADSGAAPEVGSKQDPKKFSTYTAKPQLSAKPAQQKANTPKEIRHQDAQDMDVVGKSKVKNFDAEP